MYDKELNALIPLYLIGALDEETYQAVHRYIQAHPEALETAKADYADVASISVLNTVAPDAIWEKTQAQLTALTPTITSEEKTDTVTDKLVQWLSFGRKPALGMAMAFSFMLVLTGLFAYQFTQQQTPAAIVIQLNGTAKAQEAQGTLTIDPNNGQSGVLVVRDLPPLVGGSYQLWLIKDGKRTDGGVFNTDAMGSHQLSIQAPIPLNSYQAFGITIEPDGGSPGPTGNKVMGSS